MRLQSECLHEKPHYGAVFLRSVHGIFSKLQKMPFVFSGLVPIQKAHNSAVLMVKNKNIVVWGLFWGLFFDSPATQTTE